MSKSATRWVPLFRRFIKEIRIQSKHAASDPDGKGIPLKLWTSQKRLLDEICAGLEDDIHVYYLLKSRQVGATTITAALLIFWLALHPNTIGCLALDTDKNSAKNRKMIRSYLKSLVTFMGKSFSVVADNKFGFEFSNGSRLDMLVAGKSKVAWAEGEGYLVGHLSEVSKFGKPEGISSFRHTMAPENPRSLYVFESTAMGPNHWKDMWDTAKRAQFGSRCIFLGWWSNDLHKIRMSDPKWKVFGTEPPTPEENDLISQVRKQYDFEVTMEYLAWYRYQQTQPNADEGEMDQNECWTEEQAFVESGVSFFQNRLVAQRRQFIVDANDEVEDRQEREGIEIDPSVENGGFGYKMYQFYLGDEYHLSKVESINVPMPSDQIKLRVWEKPHPEGLYVIGVDPAGGRSEASNNHCLDEETEILTKVGWRRHDQIAAGDQAVCFDVATGEYSYGLIQRVISRQTDEVLCHFEGRGVDILVTPDHRMVHRRPITGRRNPHNEWTGWRIGTAEELTHLKCQFRVPNGRAPVGEGIDGLSLDMCLALGWILTDGQFIQHGPSYTPFIRISQATGSIKNGVNVCDKMKEVLLRISPDISVLNKRVAEGEMPALIFGIGNAASPEFFRWLPGPVCLKSERRIPRNLLVETSAEQARALLQGILEGDGSWSEGKGCWHRIAPGLSEGLADDIQELALRCGFSARKCTQTSPDGRWQWIIYLSERDQRLVRFKEKTPYTGTVWCVTVPTGAFVARRGGHVFVTGNCASVWRCFADKLVQTAEWADNVPETRHCAWVTAYLAGQYQNCYINIDLTGGIGTAVMEAFDNLRTNMRSEMYQTEIRRLAQEQMEETRAKKEAAGEAPGAGQNFGVKWEFEDFLAAANWHLYRRPDAPGPGYLFNTKLGADLKFKMMNRCRDSWVTNLLEVRSIPLLDEMPRIVQTRGDIGAAAEGRDRDDRTFSMALANWTWLDNLRGGLISQGITWDGARKKEAGLISPVAEVLNRRVFQILRAADEAMDLPPPRTFFEARGL